MEADEDGRRRTKTGGDGRGMTETDGDRGRQAEMARRLTSRELSCEDSCSCSSSTMGVESGGDGGTRPPQSKNQRGTSPSEIMIFQ